MKLENVVKLVKKSVKCVNKVDFVEQYGYYCITIEGCVTLYELNSLGRFFNVSHVTSSFSVGYVDIICRLKDGVDFTPYYLHERGEL